MNRRKRHECIHRENRALSSLRRRCYRTSKCDLALERKIDQCHLWTGTLFAQAFWQSSRSFPVSIVDHVWLKRMMLQGKTNEKQMSRNEWLFKWNESWTKITDKWLNLRQYMNVTLESVKRITNFKNDCEGWKKENKWQMNVVCEFVHYPVCYSLLYMIWRVVCHTMGTPAVLFLITWTM